MEGPQRLSLLELLLPGGRAAQIQVIGSACPAALAAPAGTRGAGEPPDLLVIAPSDAESREPGWLTTACGGSLSEEGVAYLLVPRAHRRRARGLLRVRGLEVEQAILHLPDVAESRQLVPLERAPARHAFRSVVPLVPWKRAVAELLLALGGGGLIASAASSVALVARRPGARPLLEWLPLSAAAGARRSAVISTSAKPGGAGVVLQPFAAGAGPLVAKLSLRPAFDPSDEHRRLMRLAPDAARAGAAVPRPMGELRLHGNAVLLESRVEGEIVAPLLSRRPARLGLMLGRVCSWLESWQRLTASRVRLTREQLEGEVVAPARELAPRLDGADAYLNALAERCSAAEGTVVPLTASHNDLTMWNVLTDGARLGVVDWEVAEEGTLPLKDFYYAAADAVAATRRYADRPAAVRECFGNHGGHEHTIAPLQASLARAGGVSAELADLSFHACWLGHAVNEARSAGPADPTPFREVVQWLVRREAA